MGTVLALLAAAILAADDLRSAFEAVKAAQAEVEAADRAKDPARLRAARGALGPLQVRFKELFAKADWDALDAAKDRDLLGGGLLTAGLDALDRGDGRTAVRAFEAILARLGKEAFARDVALRFLPAALVAAGEPAKAAARWEESAAGPDAAAAAQASLLLGDLRCAQGDLEAARTAWRKAAARSKEEVAIRLALVGRPCPEIDSKSWFGGEAVPLSRHLGKVVVLEFLSTGNAASREAIAGLDALQAAERARGLLVLGVTHPYTDGFLPRRGTKEPAVDGEEVKGIPAAEYGAHLARFRESLGVSFPFVLADVSDYDNFGVKATPFRVLVNRGGAVAFVRTGGGDGTLFRLAVRRLLDRK